MTSQHFAVIALLLTVLIALMADDTDWRLR